VSKPAAPEVVVTGAAPTVPAVPAAPDETLAGQLFTESFSFDFFQAVRLLERLDRRRVPIGRTGPSRQEVARFRSHLSLSFPPSSIYEIERPTPTVPALMTVAFLGLTGPSGMLPRHYTELLIRVEREGKWAEKSALRDWFGQFDHRLISLFYRAWEKYRFWVAYERGDYAKAEPDSFTRALFSYIGIGTPALRNRLAVAVHEVRDEEERERRLAHIDDLSLLHFSGYLAHQPRNVVSLEALLQDFFTLPLQVNQFQGQWLVIDPGNQSMLGEANNALGISVVAGERVWDVQSRIRIRLGPLHYAQFTEFIPDRMPVPQRKAFFLLSHLVRLYVGPELDFDVQLVLKKEEVPECQLAEVGGLGPRLGWNTWVRSAPARKDAEDVVFEGDELRWIEVA
jgi:type VI secretion system protein ImpH